jgi:hypothetical protein
MMHRPFDVTANFLRINEVPLSQAASVLFGKAALATDQATYLDVMGNRNGVYDLGDFLSTTVRLGAEQRRGSGRTLFAGGVK